jgi:hypothetical protein
MSGADKLRVALAPAHVVVGATLLLRGWRVPTAALVGLLFIVFGLYRIVLVRRALRK